MTKYMQILNGKANPIKVEDTDVQPLIDAGVQLVDVTGVDLQPQAGWLYDEETGSFSVPPEADPQPVYKISKYQFFQRFTTAEKVAIKTAGNSGDVMIQVALEDLQLCTEVDLQNQGLQEYMGYLVQQGHLTQARADEILTPRYM